MTTPDTPFHPHVAIVAAATQLPTGDLEKRRHQIYPALGESDLRAARRFGVERQFADGDAVFLAGR